jgi:2,3-bisphosphoglycerate-dependent phosphoglycerate mutase
LGPSRISRRTRDILPSTFIGTSSLHVLLVRHGQTDSNAAGVLQGHLPVPLNTRGREQAERLAERLVLWEPAIDVLLTSDLRRAVETAAPVARYLGLDAEPDAAWRERGLGSFEGRTVGNTEIWQAATGTLDPPGAEPLDALQARVAAALTTLVMRHHTQRVVAVVTHGGVMRTALRLLADGRLTPTDGRVPPAVESILNGSILHLVASGAEAETITWRVVRVNDVDHLQDDDVTARDAG